MTDPVLRRAARSRLRNPKGGMKIIKQGKSVPCSRTSRASDDELLEVLAELRRAYPHVRLGQMICNFSYMTRGTKGDPAWEVEDDELLQTARDFLRQPARRMSMQRV